MKGEEFQTLVGQLGALSEGQRAALLKPLSCATKPDEVIRLIETQFDASPRCGHCGSALFKRWGVEAGLKRYKCKGCNRTFNALTGTPLATFKPVTAGWPTPRRWSTGSSSGRPPSGRASISQPHFAGGTVPESPQDHESRRLTGIVEADETFFLKSAKGSKKLVGAARESAAARREEGDLDE